MSSQRRSQHASLPKDDNETGDQRKRNGVAATRTACSRSKHTAYNARGVQRDTLGMGVRWVSLTVERKRLSELNERVYELTTCTSSTSHELNKRVHELKTLRARAVVLVLAI